MGAHAVPAASTPATPAKPGAVAPQSPTTKPQSGRNRREHERTGVSKAVVVHELGEYNAVLAGVDGTTVDVSRSGIGISMRKMMHIGRTVIILMPGPDGKNKALFGTVAYSAYKEGGLYHVGVRFCPNPGGSNVNDWLREHKAA